MGALGWLLNLEFKAGQAAPAEAPILVMASQQKPRRPEQVEMRFQVPQAVAGCRRVFQQVESELRPMAHVLDTAPTFIEDEWIHVVLGADFTTTSASEVRTGLFFTPAANTTYWVKGRFGVMARTNTTRVPYISLFLPTGLIDHALIVGVQHSTAQSGVSIGSYGPDVAGARAAGTSLPDITNIWWAELEGMLIAGPSVSGTLEVGLMSSSAIGTVSLEAGSWIAYQEVA